MLYLVRMGRDRRNGEGKKDEKGRAVDQEKGTAGRLVSEEGKK